MDRLIPRGGGHSKARRSHRYLRDPVVVAGQVAHVGPRHVPPGEARVAVAPDTHMWMEESSLEASRIRPEMETPTLVKLKM